ncbi:unnamed protein product [Brassica oleracea var. botrytis]
MTSHFREHPSWNENHASTVLVVIYYRFVEEDHRASTHHMLKQRVMRMVSGKLDSWSSLINRSRLSGHMVIVLAEEAGQELMCKSMNLTLTPLITSFLKMSASGYHKASRSYIHDSGCLTNASDNVYCTLLARSVVHGAMAGYTGYTSGLINGRPTNIPYNKDYEELAATVMTIVDCVEKIESSTDVLKGILRPVVEGVEEISWPPRDPEAINQMEKEMIQREKEGQLDEGFLSEVSAQLRQFERLKVIFRQKKIKTNQGLQLSFRKFYNSMLLRSSPSVATQREVHVLKSLAHSKLPLSTNRISSRLHPITGNEVVKVKHFLETLIKGLFMQPYFPCSQSTQRSSHLVYYVFPAPEEQWNKFFLEGRRFIPAANLDRVSQRDQVQSK